MPDPSSFNPRQHTPGKRIGAYRRKRRMAQSARRKNLGPWWHMLRGQPLEVGVIKAAVGLDTIGGMIEMQEMFP